MDVGRAGSGALSPASVTNGVLECWEDASRPSPRRAAWRTDQRVDGCVEEGSGVRWPPSCRCWRVPLQDAARLWPASGPGEVR